jgi:hypothetical protein
MKPPITKTIHQVVAKTPVYDIHTHVFERDVANFLGGGFEAFLKS